MTLFRLALWFLVFLLAAGIPAMAEMVQGTLYDQAGKESPDTQLLFINLATSDSYTVTTDSTGRFDTQLPPGDYDVFKALPVGQVFLTKVTLDDAGTQQLRLDLGENEGASLATIRDFEVGVSQTAKVSSQPLSDMINPFPARKRGRLYGTLYEFHRNDNFDARNFFDPVGEPLPEYKRNQFGVTVGTRLTEKMMLQGSYDGLRIIQGSTLLSHVPTIGMRSGDFSALETPVIDPFSGSAFEGNIIPEDRIHPIARNLLSVIPTPNRLDPDRNYVNNDPIVRDQDTAKVRFDYEPANNSKVLVDYTFVQAENQRVHPFPTFNSSQTERHQSGSVSYNSSFSPRFLTYSRASFGRNRVFSLSRNSGNAGLMQSLGIAGIEATDDTEEGYPIFYLSGYTSFGDNDSPDSAIRNSFSSEQRATYVHNAHTIRFGFEVGNVQMNNYRTDGNHRGSFGYSGNFSGDAFADFLLGYPDSAGRGVGSDRIDLRRRRWEFSLGDQWKVSPNFDISYGMTYQYVPPYHSVHDNVSGLYPLLFETPIDAEVVIAGSERADALGFDNAVEGTLTRADRNDFAPRLGMAYSPLGSNRLVLRASFSVWYDAPGEWAYMRSLGRNYPFFYNESIDTSGSIPEMTIDNPFEATATPELTMQGVEPNLRNGTGQFWQLSLQNEIARNWNLEIRYEGRSGTQGTRYLPSNVPLPGPGSIQERRPNPNFGKIGLVNDGGRFSGHGLDVSAEKRLSDGFSFRSGFEWNRMFDDAPSWGEPSNPRNLAAERATATWMPQRRFFLNYIIDLPFDSIGPLSDTANWVNWALEGWRLSGITAIQDGRPFSVTVPGDPNNDGVYSDRPDRIASGKLPDSERSINQWFDTSAFVEPELYSFGDSGRNILKAPGHHAWDISVIKQTKLSDGDTVEFRVELFNAFNQVNFNRPNSSYGTSVFGKIFGAERAREIEVALKYLF